MDYLIFKYNFNKNNMEFIIFKIMIFLSIYNRFLKIKMNFTYMI
jgi:hypothetical protein